MICQTVIIKGKVISESNAIISNANITALQNNFIKKFTQTNDNGEFSLTLNQNQKYTIHISSVGYTKQEIEINTTLINIEKTIVLQQKLTADDTVRITAKQGRYERGDTIFYNADFYMRNNENNLKDLLNNLPGVNITENGKISVDGQMVQKVLIDGKDLTGDNYEKIVNNLSPHQIDQLQVLKKYKDPFSLSDAVTGDTEMALNITFKKKKLIPSAKLSIGLGMPIKYYEQKTDFLITSKQLTGLCFANWNTIGKTFQYIASPNEILGTYRSSGFAKLGRGLQFFNKVNELYLPITSNLFSFNNSKYFDNSSQVNFSKNTTNKFTITYSPEKFEQTQNTFSRTYNGNQVIAETQSYSIPTLNNKRFLIKNEFIQMLKNKSQIKIESNYEKTEFTSIKDQLLNNKQTFIQSNNSKTIVRNLLNYTKYLTKRRLLNAAFFQEYEKNKELLNTDGIAYNGALFSNTYGLTKNLEQQKNNMENNIGAYLKIIKYKEKYSITIQPTIKYLNGNFNSTLSALSTTNIKFNNIDSFYNNYNYKQSYFSVPIRYKFNEVFDKFSLSFNVEPFVLYKQKFHSATKNNYFNYTADIGFSYKLKNNKQINFSANKRYTPANYEQLLQNNIIKNITGIQLKSSLFTSSNAYNLNVSFSNSNYKNKVQSYLNIGYTINEPNFISNGIFNNLYTTNIFLPFNNTNNSIFGNLRNTVNSKVLKLYFTQNIGYSKSNSFNSQNDILNQNNSTNYTAEHRLKSKFISFFNYELNNTFTYRESNSKNYPTIFKSYNNVSSFLINLNYQKKANLDFSVKNFYIFTPATNQKNNLLFANITYKQLMKKGKIRFSVECNNITNTKTFTNQYISATQYSEVSTILIPFFCIAKVEFLL